MHKRFYLFTLLSIVIFSSNVFAQIGATVDPTFVPAISKDVSEIGYYSAIQSDGKILVSGSFMVANGVVAPKVIRLNSDGTLDNSFNCIACDFNAGKILIQPNGRILVSGYVVIQNQPAKSKIIRLNPDGSLDSTFNFQPTPYFGTSTGSVEAIQPDGKIFVKELLSGSLFFSEYLYRINADGSKDESFTTLSADLRSRQSIKIKVLSDGRIFVFGNNSYGYLAQINSDGSKNLSFESPALTAPPSQGFPQLPPGIYDIALQTDGKLVFVGYFNTVNGLSKIGAARLNTNQSVDAGFSPTFDFAEENGIGAVYAVSNNKLLFISSGSITIDIERHNYDGTNDNTFDFPQDVLRYTSISLDASERIYMSAKYNFEEKFVRYNSNGSLDSSFNPEFEPSGQIFALGLQSDGKVILGGIYDKVNGAGRAFMSRVNADGTTDTGFDTQNKFSSDVSEIKQQSDGKILVGGNFNYEGINKKLVRLNSSGSKDTAFDVEITGNSVNSIALQTDGKILIGGSFTAVNGTSRSSIARLNSDGTLDTSFNVQLGGAMINSIVIQSDGKIMIAGGFSGVNGFNRANLARLNSDGTLDTSFNATVTSLLRLLVQPEGKYLALTTNSVIRRFNADGSLDSSLQSPAVSGGITDILLLNDGSIVIGGTFTTISDQPKNRIARLQSNGSLDSVSFVKGANDQIRRLIKQPDGKIIAGGDFTYIEDKPRTAVARIGIAAFTRPTNFDFDGDGRADIGVYRPSNSVWYQLTGANYQFSTFSFGTAEDILAPADYDGDGKTDYGIFRPSTGVWWYAASTQSNAFRAVQWGAAGDVPLPSDIDGDGKADFVVYRPSQSRWYRKTALGVNSTIDFGSAGDKPVIGDFDGDGKADPAIYRPSTGVWWYAASGSSNAQRAVQFGIWTDIPAAADYDGDGKTDFAVYRPSTGVWYILNSGSGSATIIQFGISEDKPVAADYDGDGKADIAVFRPSNGGWYLLRSSSGFLGLGFGINSDRPIPNAFVPQN